MGVKEKVNHPPLAPPIKGGEYLVAEGLIKSYKDYYFIYAGFWETRTNEVCPCLT